MTNPAIPDTTCLICGGPTVPTLAPSPSTPPYHCRACSRLWWGPELTPTARSLFSPAYRDFGTSEAAQMVRLEAQVARDDARARARARRNP